MAIQMRRGQYADLDKSKLVAGEIVVALDNNKDYVAVAKAPSDVIELATKDDIANTGRLVVEGTKLRWVSNA